MLSSKEIQDKVEAQFQSTPLDETIKSKGTLDLDIKSETKKSGLSLIEMLETMGIFNKNKSVSEESPFLSTEVKDTEEKNLDAFSRLNIVNLGKSKDIHIETSLDVVVNDFDIVHHPYYKALQNAPRRTIIEPTVRVLLRAERFTEIDQIKARGGFHPKAASNPKVGDDKSNITLDIRAHRESSDNHTGFVSTTTSSAIAKSHNETKMVTIILAKGPMLTGDGADNPYDYEQEYSIAGGLDFQAIIGYRMVEKNQFTGDVFIRNSFIENYPWALTRVLESIKEPNELVKLTPSIFAKILPSKAPRLDFTSGKAYSLPSMY